MSLKEFFCDCCAPNVGDLYNKTTEGLSMEEKRGLVGALMAGYVSEYAHISPGKGLVAVQDLTNLVIGMASHLAKEGAKVN